MANHKSSEKRARQTRLKIEETDFIKLESKISRKMC